MIFVVPVVGFVVMFLTKLSVKYDHSEEGGGLFFNLTAVFLFIAMVACWYSYAYLMNNKK